LEDETSLAALLWGFSELGIIDAWIDAWPAGAAQDVAGSLDLPILINTLAPPDDMSAPRYIYTNIA
jgi:hypothetical protein